MELISLKEIQRILMYRSRTSARKWVERKNIRRVRENPAYYIKSDFENAIRGVK